MAASTPAAPALGARTRIRPFSRVYGFGSIYGKTIRDSRLTFIIAAGLLGGMSLVMGAAIGQVFPDAKARLAIDNIIGAIPSSMIDLFGKPVNLGTLGGYMSWKYGATFALGTSLWSIMALSGTLAGEAGKGSLDLVASTPFGKRRIAFEKLLAHLTVLWLAMAIMAVMIVISSNSFGEKDLGDAVSPLSAIGFALWVGSIALFFGGIAFALGPLLGRSGSAGVAAVAMMAMWVSSGFHAAGIELLSPFHWTFNHVALAGQYDWAGLAVVGVLAVVFLAIGFELFARRDLGVTSGLSMPGLPGALLGVQNSLARSFGDLLPRALAWGFGMGVMGLLLASLVGPFADQIKKDNTLVNTFGNVFPTVDLTTAGGWLQLYAELFYIAAGFAATTFVARWASDETAGRLETVLATPLGRSHWVVTGGIAAMAAALLMAALFAVGTLIGCVSGGIAAGDATLGAFSLGVYALAIVGIGVAVGGWFRTSLAAEIAALAVVATYLIDMLAPPLKLPDWFHQLALTTHFGSPMIGHWDIAGVVASVVIAVAGVAIGAWGIRRRDIVK